MRALPLIALLFALAACDSSSDVADAGSTVTVAYVGRLADGTVFDQSTRATFSLRDVIPGFRRGVVGMTVGETRTITVPPEEGYGSVPRPGIPANSTLVFEVTLLDVE